MTILEFAEELFKKEAKMLKAEKPKSSSGIGKLPAGTYQAVCTGVYDLGKQESKFGVKHKIVISWEVNKTIETEGEFKGKRYVVSNRYTLSLHEKSNLTRDLTSWLGSVPDSLDLETLRGKNCMLGIVHKDVDGKTYVNVTSVSALVEGMQPITPELDGKPPEWVVKLRENSVKQPTNDEIPF